MPSKNDHKVSWWQRPIALYWFFFWGAQIPVDIKSGIISFDLLKVGPWTISSEWDWSFSNTLAMFIYMALFSFVVRYVFLNLPRRQSYYIYLVALILALLPELMRGFIEFFDGTKTQSLVLYSLGSQILAWATRAYFHSFSGRSYLVTGVRGLPNEINRNQQKKKKQP